MASLGKDNRENRSDSKETTLGAFVSRWKLNEFGSRRIIYFPVTVSTEARNGGGVGGRGLDGGKRVDLGKKFQLINRILRGDLHLVCKNYLFNCKNILEMVPSKMVEDICGGMELNLSDLEAMALESILVIYSIRFFAQNNNLVKNSLKGDFSVGIVEGNGDFENHKAQIMDRVHRMQNQPSSQELSETSDNGKNNETGNESDVFQVQEDLEVLEFLKGKRNVQLPLIWNLGENARIPGILDNLGEDRSWQNIIRIEGEEGVLNTGLNMNGGRQGVKGRDSGSKTDFKMVINKYEEILRMTEIVDLVSRKYSSI